MRTPRVSHYRHTARVRPHHETSYALLTFLVMVAGVVMIMFTQSAQADPPPIQGDIIVNAIVLPKAPIISTPTTGQHFTVSPIVVTGLCQAQPSLLVKLYKNGVFTGSANCTSSGTFSITTDLFFGRNDFVARQYDLFDNASPDSNLVTVYLDKSPPVIGGEKIPQLILRSDSASKGASQGAEITWPAEIVGGKEPYAISWDWGDGSLDVISRTDAGVFTVKHTYAKPGNYVIKVRATDNSGQLAFLQLTAYISGGVGQASAERRWFDGGLLLILWPLYVLMLIMLLSFWLGERYEYWKLKHTPGDPGSESGAGSGQRTETGTQSPPPNNPTGATV